MYGKDQTEHDFQLEQVMQRLLSKPVFMGHILSAKGIDPDRAKVVAIQHASAPQTAAEVRSFWVS